MCSNHRPKSQLLQTKEFYFLVTLLAKVVWCLLGGALLGAIVRHPVSLPSVFAVFFVESLILHDGFL